MSLISTLRVARGLWFVAALFGSFQLHIGAGAQQVPPNAEATGRGLGSVTGELLVLLADDFDNQRSELVHLLRDERTGKEFRLRFEQTPPTDLRSGVRATVRGRITESEIVVAAADGESLTLHGSSTPIASTAGSNRAIVMVANFRDASVACSIQSITDMMFSDPTGRSVAALYRECSLGRIDLSGDVAGPYTIDFASTDPCDLTAWTRAIESQVTAAGIDLSGYHHKVYVLPQSQCVASGYGTMSSTPSSAWIFRCGVIGVYAHEFGHNLGMFHAATPTTEYDDGTDPMTIGYNMLMGVNAPHRQQLGWHGRDSVKVIDQDGAYEVAPLAQDPAAATVPQILMIRKPDTNEYYYLSYRLPIGFDRSIDRSFHERLSIHRYPGDGSSTKTYRLAGLADGESFVDDANGITVTLLAHGSYSATASVSFSPAPGALAISASPSTQSSTAGASRSFGVAVTDQGSASGIASTVALSASVPPGWAASLAPASLTIPSGGSAAATLTVTSAADASSATYPVSIQASDLARPVRTASAEAFFAIESAADTLPPSAPTELTATASQKQKGIQLSWNASSDDVGIEGYRVWRDGVLTGASATTSWVDSAVVPGATYTYVVEAYDPSGNRSAPSNSARAALPGKKRKEP